MKVYIISLYINLFFILVWNLLLVIKKVSPKKRWGNITNFLQFDKKKRKNSTNDTVTENVKGRANNTQINQTVEIIIIWTYNIVSSFFHKKYFHLAFQECQRSIDDNQVGKYYCVYFDEGCYWGRLLKVQRLKNILLIFLLFINC